MMKNLLLILALFGLCFASNNQAFAAMAVASPGTSVTAEAAPTSTT